MRKAGAVKMLGGSCDGWYTRMHPGAGLHVPFECALDSPPCRCSGTYTEVYYFDWDLKMYVYAKDVRESLPFLEEVYRA